MKGLLVILLFVVLTVVSARHSIRYNDIDEDDIREFLEAKRYESNDVEDEDDDEINEDEELVINRRYSDPLFTSWRPRISGAIKRNIILRALKPACAGCAGICERKVPGRCACRTDQACLRNRYG